LLNRYAIVYRARCRPTSDLLFVGPRGGKLDGATYSKRFAQYVRMANLSVPVSLHRLRHFAATAMLAQGASIELVSRQLGHADSRITSQVYSHVGFSDVADMHRQYDPLAYVANA
jgi:integrase/recombinase XerD